MRHIRDPIEMAVFYGHYTGDAKKDGALAIPGHRGSGHLGQQQ